MVISIEDIETILKDYHNINEDPRFIDVADKCRMQLHDVVYPQSEKIYEEMYELFERKNPGCSKNLGLSDYFGFDPAKEMVNYPKLRSFLPTLDRILDDSEPQIEKDLVAAGFDRCFVHIIKQSYYSFFFKGLFPSMHQHLSMPGVYFGEED